MEDIKITINIDKPFDTMKEVIDYVSAELVREIEVRCPKPKKYSEYRGVFFKEKTETEVVYLVRYGGVREDNPEFHAALSEGKRKRGENQNEA